MISKPGRIQPNRAVVNRTLAATARRFHDLHAKGSILVLPNAWDAVSARLVVDAGAAAVATSSAAVSWSLGVQDGNALSSELMLNNLARMVAAVDVPVTGDIEAGYGTTAAEVADVISAVLAVGAVGVNIEDQRGGVFRSPAEQSALIAAARMVANEAGVELFINARTDTYLAGDGNFDESDFDETVERARSYLASGASGIFVPGVADLGLIRRLVRAIDAPVNILVGPGSPSISELSAAGVRRASAGSSIAQAICGHTRRAAAELLGAGTYTGLADPISHAQLNALMSWPPDGDQVLASRSPKQDSSEK